MSLSTIPDLLVIVKKFINRKFTGLQIIIFLSVLLVTYSLYNVRNDTDNIKSAVQLLQTNTINTAQFESVVKDMTGIKNDISEVKSNVKDIKTALFYNNFKVSPYLSLNTNTNVSVSQLQ